MLAIGAVASALVIPFILEATFQAYGIADVMPRLGMNPERALPAPQAALMATIAKGFFVGKLPWHMIFGGAALAVVAILFDLLLKRSKSSFRFPVMLFALGIYLPFGYILAFTVGGVIQFMVERQNGSKPSETSHGILCASGMIAGDAILGAILTIFFAYSSTEVFALNLDWLKPFEGVLAVAFYLGLCVYLYRQGKNQ
jgi:putative OPT family oligopeptide transporter